MTEKGAADEIIRLGKLNLNPELQEILAEARRVLANGCILEAEALLQNVEARFHYLQSQKGSSRGFGAAG
jgi:hypothetical protein